jgi:hypothetical protein
MCMYIHLNECLLKYILSHTVQFCDMTCALFGVLLRYLDDAHEIKEILEIAVKISQFYFYGSSHSP